jgi:SAM-dependent methyltransferase
MKQRLQQRHKYISIRNLSTRFVQARRYSRLNDELTFSGVFHGMDMDKIGNILDLGCGRARELSRVNNNARFVVGIDIKRHDNWINLNSNVDFLVASGSHLPFRSDIFDFVFLKDVMHHLSKDQIRVVEREAFRVTNESGTRRIIEANRYHIMPLLVYKQDKSHDHFTKDYLVRMFPHDEVYGYELLPSASPLKTAFLWNFFVLIFVLLTTWTKCMSALVLYLRTRTLLFRNSLSYYTYSLKKGLV